MARVVVADDDPGVLAIVHDVIGAMGHDVHSVTTGEAAIAECQRSRPDLLILDLLMPSGSGFDVLDCLGAHAFPVIAMSAIAGLREQGYVRQLGAEDFLAKPFEISELESKVRQWLGR